MFYIRVYVSTHDVVSSLSWTSRSAHPSPSRLSQLALPRPPGEPDRRSVHARALVVPPGAS